MEQRLAHEAHYLKVGGSNPPPATLGAAPCDGDGFLGAAPRDGDGDGCLADSNN